MCLDLRETKRGFIFVTTKTNNMSYPAGAQYDNLAPYNQPDHEEEEVIDIEERIDDIFQTVSTENYEEYLKELKELDPSQVKEFNKYYNEFVK